ncbi:MAG: sugar transferase [Ruminococcus sp.]|nr:sugar transferase [Ruminococcus sp.]
MFLKSFEKLPPELRNDSVREYYDILSKKRFSIFFKRLTDILIALILLILLLIPMAVIAIIVKVNSKGPVFYRQERVTTYNRRFKILKFRTMTVGADKAGALVTSANDARVTSVGKKLRKFRLDELPQIFHVLSGKMSFVGTRPEVPRYVDRYQPEMTATLLMPAGITSLASIRYKDEDKIIGAVSDPEEVDRIYLEEILPEKMKYNLEYLKDFSFFGDIKLMLATFKNVI